MLSASRACLQGKSKWALMLQPILQTTTSTASKQVLTRFHWFVFEISFFSLLGKTYYYRLYATFGLLLANFKLTWSDEKSYQKSKLATRDAFYDHEAQETAKAAADKRGPYGTLVLFRESSFAYSQLQTKVLVDGQTVGNGASLLSNKGRWEVRLSPGEHTLRLYDIALNTKPDDAKWHDMSILVQEGVTSYYEADIHSGALSSSFLLKERTAAEADKHRRTPVLADLRQ